MGSDANLLDYSDVKVAVAPVCQAIAFAKHSTLFIISIQQLSYSQTPCRVNDVCVYDGETITTLQWISLSSDLNVLVVGTSEGFVRFFTQDGQLIFEKRFHEAPIIKMKTKCASPSMNILMDNITSRNQGETSDPRLALLLDPAASDLIIVQSRLAIRLHMKSLSDFLAQKIQSLEKGPQNESPDLDFSYKAYLLHGIFRVNDAVFYNPTLPFSIFDLFKSSHTEEGLLGFGSDPCMAVFDHDEGDQSLSTTKMVSHVATKVTTAVYSFAKNFLFNALTPYEIEEENQTKQPGEEIKLTPIGARHQFVDVPREINSAVLDYTNRYIATSDTIGRVMLFDAQRHVALHLAKGLRDATVGWTYIAKKIYDEESKSCVKDLELRPILVIHAPLKQTLELREPVQFEVLARVRVSTDSVLLSVPSQVQSKDSDRDNNGVVDFVLLEQGGQIRKISIALDTE